MKTITTVTEFPEVGDKIKYYDLFVQNGKIIEVRTSDIMWEGEYHQNQIYVIIEGERYKRQIPLFCITWNKELNCWEQIV